MPDKTIKVSGSSDMDLLTRMAAMEKINKLPTDQLKRLNQLSEIPKAKGYLESALKFEGLKILLK